MSPGCCALPGETAAPDPRLAPPDRRGRVHSWSLYTHSHRRFHTGGTPMQWQRYSRGFMLIMLGGLLVGQPVAWGQQPKSGGTLTVGLAADIAHFDVFHAIGYEAYWALGNIHSGLVRVDPQGQIFPDMAMSWDITDDGRTYVFHLHPGILFHDGTPANAEAIKWNFEYILDPANSADTRVFYRS